MLVHEVLSRNMHDRRAIARYAGLPSTPRSVTYFTVRPANPENVGSTQQSRSYISVHWAAIFTWTNFSAHALASW
jgi:hypothetical protein